MPAPKRANTAAATAAVQRKAEDRKAAELTARGWQCTPPEDICACLRNPLGHTREVHELLWSPRYGPDAT
jgi:hypothetical protein